MFRFTSRASPVQNFNLGANSINYFGKEMSRRCFNRSNAPVVKGFINPANLLAAGIPSSAFASLWCPEQASIVQLGGEAALNGILGSMLTDAVVRLGAAPMNDCASILSRTLLSNAMSMQWTLCCCKMVVAVTDKK